MDDNWKTFRGKAEAIARHSFSWPDYHLGQDLYTAKILSAGFEPTPGETDFDSVAVTTWLRPVKQSSEETIHDWPSRCVSIEKKQLFGRFQTCGVQEEQILILLR
jgi:hypothetical protein